jgi:8-oxo-dGTP pyrophosphatase MutT (NUDIX family)
VTSYDVKLPDWLRPLAEASENVDPMSLSRFVPPDEPGIRQSAVLILLAEDSADSEARSPSPDILLTERAWTLRSHAGQMAFPGGRMDDTDDSVVDAALREAQEETGLDPAGVDVFAVWPALWVPVSNFSVAPVLGWWREPSPVAVVDPAEVASVHRIAIDALTDPRNRATCLHPSGFTGPAFLVHGLFIWGFTAGLLDRMLSMAGWARDWDRTRVVPLPQRLVDAAWRDRVPHSPELRRLTRIEHDLARPDDEA